MLTFTIGIQDALLFPRTNDGRGPCVGLGGLTSAEPSLRLWVTVFVSALHNNSVFRDLFKLNNPNLAAVLLISAGVHVVRHSMKIRIPMMTD